MIQEEIFTKIVAHQFEEAAQLAQEAKIDFDELVAEKYGFLFFALKLEKEQTILKLEKIFEAKELKFIGIKKENGNDK